MKVPYYDSDEDIMIDLNLYELMMGKIEIEIHDEIRSFERRLEEAYQQIQEKVIPNISKDWLTSIHNRIKHK